MSRERVVRVYDYEDDGFSGTRGEGVRALPGSLTVSNVNFKIPDNGRAHHTDRFAVSHLDNPNKKLVVRRGQPFSIGVKFSRPYDQRTDDLKLVFQTGNEPSANNGTYVELILSNKDVPNEWGAKIVSQKNDTLSIDIFTPPTCIVAKWVFKIDVVKRGDTEVSVYRYTAKNPIYILFNPWCKNDLVYMDDENLLKEYILNETGHIYFGTYTSITEKPWNYGQFESSVLDVALYLLDKANMKWASRGNPVIVGRRLSALINAQDDNGVLVGKWDGPYSDGTPPLEWTGSVPILEQYGSTQSPVLFGQCWVFSGVATTVFRALGIPARAVTNFASAHDTDGSLTIDNLVDNNGEPVKHRDSFWNFHVWTEIWMARPDLPPGYGGWQVVDATPQEISEGTYCCGPTSVTAVQQGDVNILYDGPFVFAEVNADVVYWRANELGVMECIHIDKSAIGKFISTKAPNSNQREDLTLNYKHAEGTAEERAVVVKANQVGSIRPAMYTPKASDVNFSVEQDSANTWVGKNFVVGLKMENNSGKSRSVHGRIVVGSRHYNGTMGDTLKSEPFQVELQAREETVQNVMVTPEEYIGHLKDGCIIDVSTFAIVKETNQNFVNKKDFRLRKPHLMLKAPAEIAENEQFKVKISFTNPLYITLTNCSITVDGVIMRQTFPQANVPPHGAVKVSLVLSPKKTGHGEIIIIFNSKELQDINISSPLFIREI